MTTGEFPAGVQAVHPFDSVVPLQSVPTPPSANLDANYKLYNAFAEISHLHKSWDTFLFPKGMIGMKQNVNIVNSLIGRTAILWLNQYHMEGDGYQLGQYTHKC